MITPSPNETVGALRRVVHWPHRRPTQGADARPRGRCRRWAERSAFARTRRSRARQWYLELPATRHINNEAEATKGGVSYIEAEAGRSYGRFGTSCNATSNGFTLLASVKEVDW